MKNIGILSLLMLLFFSSCREDVDNMSMSTTPLPTPPVVVFEQPQEIVTSSVIGYVVDENEAPVKDAVVQLGTNTTTTDEYGHFFFNNRQMNHRGAFVTISKSGYFKGSRRFFPVANEENRVKIELLPMVFSASFNSQEGAVIEANGGAKVEFSSNSIKNADGSLYNGMVSVATRWMDPTDLRTLDQMPGNLQGLTPEAEEVALATFGMIAVELEGANGEALNIADGSTATLTMPVPAAIANAPAEIPLWSFSDMYGVWIEESTATLQNGNYVGEVSHFSFWNCDFPGELVTFDATLVDSDGNPLANHYVQITFAEQDGWWGSGSGFTCEDGQLSGLIPANAILNLEVYDICGNVVFTQEIGPFAEDTDLGDIVVTGLTVNSTTVSGEIVDCDGNGLTNSVAIVEHDGISQYVYTEGGSFEYSITTCATTGALTVTGVDLDELIQSDPVTTAANGTFDLGEISVCDGPQVENYIKVTVDGVSQIYPGANLYASPDSTTNAQYYSVSLFDNNQTISMNFGWSDEMGLMTGEFLDRAWFEGIQDTNNGWQFWGETTAYDNFTITANGPNVGDVVEGNFNAPAVLNFADSTTVSLMVEFSLLRQ